MNYHEARRLTMSLGSSTKQAERDYPLHFETKVLTDIPYNCPRLLREFSLALEVLQKVIPAGGSILDLGCGSGWTSLLLTRAGWDVIGVDISERMVEVAQERLEHDRCGATFHVADMEELDLKRKDFDGVLVFDALHHCPNFPAVLQRACAHLRPGGHLFLMEPSWLHLLSPHARQASRIYGVTELGFTRWCLRRALKRAGFRLIRHYYDCGSGYRGLGGFLLANIRLWCGYLFCFPRIKQIVLAQKCPRLEVPGRRHAGSSVVRALLAPAAA
jgi:SAM-dependent methyltransferase